MTYAWIEIGDGRSVYRRVQQDMPVRRSHLPAPMLISDHMPPAEHLDGKFYDSKSEFRKVTKANGCIEIGDDPGRLKQKKKPEPDEKAIRASVGKAINRFKNG